MILFNAAVGNSSEVESCLPEGRSLARMLSDTAWPVRHAVPVGRGMLFVNSYRDGGRLSFAHAISIGRQTARSCFVL